MLSAAITLCSNIYSFPHSIGPSVFLSVQTTTSRFVLDNSYSCNQTNNPLDHSHSFNSTWSYENRVSKHFVIFRHMFTVLFFDICLLCCLLMSVFSSCFVAMDLCRSGCRQNYYLTFPPTPPPFRFVFPTHNSFFDTSDSYLKSARA